MSPAADRNLLFGILALQMDFVTRDQLVAAMGAWVLNKARSLGSILADQGVLDGERRTLLEALVKHHVHQHHDDPQQSLAALSPPARGDARSVIQDLQNLGDADVEASLLLLPKRRDEDSISADQPPTVSYHPAAGARFRILRPHAEGGLGKVSVALDEELNREVALKEIKDLHADNTDSRGRFLLEAEITGGLEHPGIVPVYSLGTYADGRPFYAMRFIKGDSLKDAIARFHKNITAENAEERRASSLRPSAFSAVDFSSLNFRQLLGRFIDVCNAIAYAHSRGVLHRDLKPGNIMLGKYGETLVVDWGLAKAVGRRQEAGGKNDEAACGLADAASAEQPLRPGSGSSDQTIPGSALGTPAYMSPEQAAGRLDLLGPASDVYSLGATLYQALTGQPAFAEPDIAAVLHKVRRGDFAPPRQRNPQIPAALEAICLKAMALEPQTRYAAAKDLADDIEHWLADEPVSAFGEPWPVRAGRLARKHKTLVAGAAAALLVAVISSIAGNLILSKANEDLADANTKITTTEQETNEANLKLAKEQIETKLARDEARKSAKESSQRADKIEEDFATSTMQLARSRFEQSNADLADELLKQVPAKYRLSPWDLLKNYVAGGLVTLRGHNGGVSSVTFSHDGQVVASAGGSDKTVKLSDARTGQELRALRGHTNGVTSVAFSPDGQVVASGSYDKSVKLWDARTGKEIRTIRGHTHSVSSVTFSPDGHVVASGSHDKTVKLWNARTGQEIRTIRGHTHSVSSVTFSPDGHVVASGSHDKTVKLWDGRTGQELRALRGHVQSVSCVAFSPDGQVVASGSHDKTVKLWNADTGKELHTLRGHRNFVTSATLSPDGQLVASASWDTTAKMWDTRTGQELRSLHGHTSSVDSVSFSPDGQIVASASWDSTVKLWDAGSRQELRALRGHKSPINSVAFSPDGQIVALGNWGLWDTRTGQELRALHGCTSLVNGVTFSPDGQVVATGNSDKTVKLWNAHTGKEIRALRGHNAIVSKEAFDPDGKGITFETVHSVTFSPNGQFVASGSVDKTVKLWDADTGKELHTLRGHRSNVTSVAFSPDGQVVASASWDTTAILWDTRTGQELRSLHGHTNLVNSVSFSPDGQTVASGSSDTTVRLWNARTGNIIRAPLRGHTDGVTSVAFSPDGQIVASGSEDGTVKLWDARTGQEIRILRGHTDGVTSVAFSPDGQVLTSGGHDSTVRFWDVRTSTEGSASAKKFWFATTSPDPAEHRHHALQADKDKQPFAAACRLGHAIAARLRLQLSPWDPAGSVHVVANGCTPVAALAGYAGLLDGRKAQTAFVDGATFAGILLKDSGRSPKCLVLRAQWAVDQWPQGWQNREVLGAALYRDEDYQGAARELTQSQKLRPATGSGGNGKVSIFSCHFLALAHHKLGNANEAASWRIKAVMPRDANWEDAMIDRYLRREVEAELKLK